MEGYERESQSVTEKNLLAVWMADTEDAVKNLRDVANTRVQLETRQNTISEEIRKHKEILAGLQSEDEQLKEQIGDNATQFNSLRMKLRELCEAPHDFCSSPTM